MAFLTGQVSCPSNAVTTIVPVSNVNFTPSSGKRSPSRFVVILNSGSWGVYLGGSAMTTVNASTTGYLLASGSSLPFWLYPDEGVFGVAASFTGTISYSESGG